MKTTACHRIFFLGCCGLSVERLVTLLVSHNVGKLVDLRHTSFGCGMDCELCLSSQELLGQLTSHGIGYVDMGAHVHDGQRGEDLQYNRARQLLLLISATAHVIQMAGEQRVALLHQGEAQGSREGTATLCSMLSERYSKVSRIAADGSLEDFPPRTLPAS